MEEILGWLLFKPFISIFHAAVILSGAADSPRARILKPAMAGALVLATAGLLAVVVGMWFRADWTVVIVAAVTTVAGCYIAGILAAIIESDTA